MNVAALATDMSQLKLSSEINVAVAKKSMDAAKQQGAAALELLRSAANVQSASPDGVGTRVDVRG